LLTRIKAIPGVEAATIGNFISPLGGADSKYSIDGTAPEESRRMLVHLGSADYLRTLGIALLRGEMLAPHQVEDGAAVAVINEAAAALWPPEQNPIGSRLRLDVLERSDRENVFRREGLEPYVTVIGVVGNTKNDGLRNKPRPEVIMPYTLLVPPTRTLAIRSRGDSGLLLAAIRRQVAEMDREQPLGRPESLEEELGYQTLQPRFSVALFVTFAAVGLTLSLSGIYSLLSYWVARRTREMGVRMALGARQADVMRLVMGGGGKLLGWGLLVGIPASLAAARLLQSELFEVNSSDPLSLAGVVVLLCLAGAAACYIPARRAASIQPMAALRQD
jgi:predicted permease